MSQPFTNAPGTGLDAHGNLLPGWRYVTYSNGVGMGTPINIGDAANSFAPGSTGANLAGLGSVDYAQAPNSYQQQAQQVMARGSGDTTAGIGAQQQRTRSMYQPQPFQSAPAMGGMWPSSWSGVNSSGPAWQGNQPGTQWSTPGMRSSPYGGYSSYGGGLLGGGSVQYRRGLLG